MKVYIVVDEFTSGIVNVFKYKYKAEEYLKSKGLKLFDKKYWAKSRDDFENDIYYEITVRGLRE